MCACVCQYLLRYSLFLILLLLSFKKEVSETDISFPKDI